MSRFSEGTEFEDEEAEQKFYDDIKAAYKLASADLAGFLDHLDAMPVKVIIADRFMMPSTGAKCAVAEFCNFKGVGRKELLAAEKESRFERMSDEWDGAEAEGGWEGPTVGMGMRAGLPQLVAFNMAWYNDMVWDEIEDGEETVPGVRGRLPDGVKAEGVNWWCNLVPDPNGNYWMQRPYTRPKYRPMTDVERWLKLRNHVAKRIGQPLLESLPSAYILGSI